MLGLVRFVLVALVRLFYPRIELEGREKVPTTGPVIFLANHPNGLVDPLIVQIASGRRCSFLGKSTLFNNPIFRVLMAAFDGIPVYRAKDVGQGGGDMSQNEKTFSLCRQRLAKSGAIALFPEGVSHSDPHLKPLKTGAARIALSAEAENNFGLGLMIVPVGLYYEQKAIFRSRVVARVGQVIDVRTFAEKYRENERSTVEELTDSIRDCLEDVVLQAETKELLEGVARIAVFTAEDESARDDLGEQTDRAQQLLDGYRQLQMREPEKLNQIVSHAQAYMRILRALGVSDPWAVEVGRVGLGAVIRTSLKLVFLFPFALIGALLAWVPYRLTRDIAKWYSKDDDDILGTVKLLGGILFIGSTWIVEAVLAAYFVGWQAALVLAILAPITGYASLHFDETTTDAFEALRHLWIRVNNPKIALRLIERRKALANEVASALRAVSQASTLSSRVTTTEGSA